jgi:hypothetical protein
MMIRDLIDDLEFLSRRHLEAVEKEDWTGVEAYDRARIGLASVLTCAINNHIMPPDLQDRLHTIITICTDTQKAIEAADARRKSEQQNSVRALTAELLYQQVDAA